MITLILKVITAGQNKWLYLYIYLCSTSCIYLYNNIWIHRFYVSDWEYAETSQSRQIMILLFFPRMSYLDWVRTNFARSWEKKNTSFQSPFPFLRFCDVFYVMHYHYKNGSKKKMEASWRKTLLPLLFVWTRKKFHLFSFAWESKMGIWGQEVE